MQWASIAKNLALTAVWAGILLLLGGCPPAGDEAVQPTSPVFESEPALEPEAKPTPKLDLKISGPAQVKVGQQFTVEIIIENRSQLPATDLLIKDRFDPGLEHVEHAGPVERDLGELAAGQSHRVGIELRATRAGVLSHTVEITSGGEVLASDWSSVAATAESMAPDPSGALPTGPSEDSQPEARPDLAAPLVDDPESLQKLHPFYPVWFDKAGRSVVMVGAVCQSRGPLELFACLKDSKEHESVVAVATQAYVVHAGLLATGAEPGSPVQFYPQYVPASGTEIEVEVIWKDEQGRLQRARAQDWVRNMETQQAMDLPWVFAGSRFYQDDTTGQRFYQADGTGELICVANFPSAVLDVPVKSSDSDAALLFEAFAERIPPRGTPVTLVLTPKLENQADVAPAKGKEAGAPQGEANDAGLWQHHVTQPKPKADGTKQAASEKAETPPETAD